MRTLTAITFVFLFMGCSSTEEHRSDSVGESLAAPVRDSSTVVQSEPQPLVLDGTNSEQDSTDLGGLEFSSDLAEAVAVQEAGEPSVTATAEHVEAPEPSPEPVLDVAQVQAQAPKPEPIPIPTEAPTRAAPVSDSEIPEEPEVEGLVQLALPEDVEVSVGEEEGTESDVATYLLDEAENSFERENYERARGQSERALTVEPTAARAYLILARVELAEGRPEQAAEMARQGLASSSDSDETFEELNQILGEIAEIQTLPDSEEDQEAPPQPEAVSP